MDKETVILEPVDESNSEIVSVIPFDIISKQITGTCIEVLSREEAQEEYEIVGDMINGELKIYDEDYGEEAFIDDSFYIDEDE